MVTENVEAIAKQQACQGHIGDGWKTPQMPNACKRGNKLSL